MFEIHPKQTIKEKIKYDKIEKGFPRGFAWKPLEKFWYLALITVALPSCDTIAIPSFHHFRTTLE